MSKGIATRNWALKPDERVILCCSSTRHRRFTDDLVAVMSLPRGSRVRLRYSDDVCDPAVRNLGNQADPSLIGLQVLIAHVGFQAGSTAVHPLRAASVVELRTLGSFTFLDVELSDFVETQVGTGFWDLLQPLATCSLPVQTTHEDKPSGFFCQFLSRPPPLVSGQDDGLWERVARLFLSAIEDSSGAFPFIFNVEVVKKRTRKPVPLRNGALIVPAISNIELHIRTLASEAYFDSTIKEPVGTLALTINHPDARLATGAHHPIDTTRNLLLSRITTSISLRPAYGSLTVTARRFNSSETSPTLVETTAEAERPNAGKPTSAGRVNEVIVEMPLAVGRGWMRGLAIFLISVGLAAHAFDIDGLCEHANYVWWKAGIVLVAALVALFMGLKPQPGD